MRHSADRKVCRTTKALEFAVLVVKKMAFELGWEELLPHEDAISDVVDADTESLLLAASQLFEPPEEPTENDDFVDAETESMRRLSRCLSQPLNSTSRLKNQPLVTVGSELRGPPVRSWR